MEKSIISLIKEKEDYFDQNDENKLTYISENLLVKGFDCSLIFEDFDCENFSHSFKKKVLKYINIEFVLLEENKNLSNSEELDDTEKSLNNVPTNYIKNGILYFYKDFLNNIVSIESLETYETHKRTIQKSIKKEKSKKSNYHIYNIKHHLEDYLKEFLNIEQAQLDLCGSLIYHLVKEHLKDLKTENELLLIEYFQNFNIPPKRDGNHFSYYKVFKVNEIKFKNILKYFKNKDTLKNIFNWFNDIKEKWKIQEVIMETGEIFYVSYSDSAKGIKPYYILDFEVEKETLRMKRTSIKSRNIDNFKRKITVYGKEYPSILQAYKDIKPFHSYGTICKKTKNKKLTEDEINQIFEKSDKNSKYHNGPRSYGEKDLIKILK